MTFHENDPNRPLNEPYVRRPIDDRDAGVSWAPFAALIAMALIFGGLFLLPSNDRTTTASNDAPVSRQTNPSTPTPTPAPAAPTRTQ